MRNFAFLYSLLFIVLISLSCTTEPYLPDNPCEAGFIDFEQEILPLIASQCAVSGCHDAGTREDGIQLDSYAGIIDIVQAFELDNSELWEVINESSSDEVMPPPPRQKLSSVQRELIKQWISQGAMNLSCEGRCDTISPMSYALHIQPIIQSSCVGCHGPNLQEAGLRLDAYTDAMSAVDSKQLELHIQAGTGYSIMPPSGPLTNCSQRSIILWINQGMPQ